MGAPPSASTALQLVGDAPHAAWGEALNIQVPWYGEAHPASQVNSPAAEPCRFVSLSSIPANLKLPSLNTSLRDTARRLRDGAVPAQRFARPVRVDYHSNMHAVILNIYAMSALRHRVKSFACCCMAQALGQTES